MTINSCSMTIMARLLLAKIAFKQSKKTMIAKVKVKDSKITVKIKQSAAVWKKVKPVSYLFNAPKLKHTFGMYFKAYICKVYRLLRFASLFP